VLKASLAVQHGQIPANLHFNKLNPKIQPYYSSLRIPTETIPWPTVPVGSPRRVSVNSFGFGGTNAHAIIESWDGPNYLANGHAVNGNTTHHHTLNGHLPVAHGAGPFVLSANSGSALAASAGALASYLCAHPDTDLDQLAYTLSRRTELPFRASFSATSGEQLIGKL
jgi:acyl transferase domain-containing protein